MEFKTEIKDAKLAVEAIHASGFKCRRRDKRITILDGTNRAVLDLKTGTIATDVGPPFSKKLDLLRQYYPKRDTEPKRRSRASPSQAAP